MSWSRSEILKIYQKTLKRSAVVAILSLLYVISASAQTTSVDVVRIDTNLVNVFFSALDKNNNFVAALTRTDIELYEDDVEQKILTFETNTNRALSIAILIDVSGSQKNMLPEEKEAARLFVRTIGKNTNDKIGVVSFAADPYLEQNLTNRITDIELAIDRVVRRGSGKYGGIGTILPPAAIPASGSLSYSSAIWDALWITCNTLMSVSDPKTRNVIILVTDGEDTSSGATLEEAISRAIQAEAVVYAVGVGDESIATGVNSDTLKKIVSRTGGHFFQPKKKNDLNLAFSRIEKELRSQYVITYTPQKADSATYRQLHLEIRNKDLKNQIRSLTYRNRYFFRGNNQ